MYFFDIEDYLGPTRDQFNADVKANSGGRGNVYCGRGVYGADWYDLTQTATETFNAFSKYVNDWFSASTITIGNSTNTLARNIYYNDYIPNYFEYQINRIKYFNQGNTGLSKKYWESACIDGTVQQNGYNPCSYATYNDYWGSLVKDGSLIGTYGNNVTYSGATNYLIQSASSITNTYVSVPYTIVHPQFNDWNDSYYYNYNNSLRKVMGSLKRLMKAIDNDTFEEFSS